MSVELEEAKKQGNITSARVTLVRDKLQEQLKKLRELWDEGVRLSEAKANLQKELASAESKLIPARELIAYMSDAYPIDLNVKLEQIKSDLSALKTGLERETFARDNKSKWPGFEIPIYKSGGRSEIRVRVFRNEPTGISARQPSDDGYHPTHSPVSSLPDVYAMTLPDDTQALVVMGCDGIFDELSSEQAIQTAKTALEKNQDPAQALVEKAYKMGSTDNMTAVVIRIPARPRTDSPSRRRSSVRTRQ